MNNRYSEWIQISDFSFIFAWCLPDSSLFRFLYYYNNIKIIYNNKYYLPSNTESSPHALLKLKTEITESTIFPARWGQTRGLRFSLWGQTRGLASDYCSSSLDVRRMILVAPRVKRVPSSITRRSRGLSSTLSTKVPVLLLLSFRVYLRFPRLSRLTVIVQ